MSTISDTIYALASGHGKAGVAVFRISGAKAFSVLHALGVTQPIAPRTATLVTLHQPLETPPPARGRLGGGRNMPEPFPAGVPHLTSPLQGEELPTHHPHLAGSSAIDTALALTFPGPNSFTGEDVLELHTHGSRAVITLLLQTLATLPGLRLAEPGEFAKRAFLNNKFDLLEAEGLADLIDADTPAQHAQAMRQLGGELSMRVMALREKILPPLALLEAYIDFPDEEIPEETLAEVTAAIARLKNEVEALLNDGGIGEKIRDGIEIVIFGPPNAGKSSLLNTIAKRDVAIVSDEAGTTRDMIEVHLNLDGYPVTLVDTAGLREADGKIEAEGIRRAHHRLEHAALKIALLDATTAAEDYKYIAPHIDDKTLIIINKIDINRHSRESGNPQSASGCAPEIPAFAGMTVGISATTGENLDQFLVLLKARVAALLGDAPSPLITRARHRQAFHHAITALTRFDPKKPLELNGEELRIAALEIGKITGKITTDDLLDLVFSRFCIGK